MWNQSNHNRKDELRCVKRTDLMNIMADNLPQNTVRFGCNVLSIELDPRTSSPVLHLQDGTSLKAMVCSLQLIRSVFRCLPLSLNLIIIICFSTNIWIINQVVIGCDGVNSRISYMMGVMAKNIFNVYVVKGFTIYPSGHEFGNEFKMTKKDDVQVGLMPITTNLVYWFSTGKHISESKYVTKRYIY